MLKDSAAKWKILKKVVNWGEIKAYGECLEKNSMFKEIWNLKHKKNEMSELRLNGFRDDESWEK